KRGDGCSEPWSGGGVVNVHSGPRLSCADDTKPAPRASRSPPGRTLVDSRVRAAAGWRRPLRGRDDRAPRRQGVAKALARADPELQEHLLQMPLDGARAEEQLGADLRVGPAGDGKPRDVLLLRCELVAGVVAALGGGLAGREQLVARTLAEPVRANRAEQLVRGAQVLARVRPAGRAAQELAVEQMPA